MMLGEIPVTVGVRNLSKGVRHRKYHVDKRELGIIFQ
jgi:hypothetical protein